MGQFTYDGICFRVLLQSPSMSPCVSSVMRIWLACLVYELIDQWIGMAQVANVDKTYLLHVFFYQRGTSLYSENRS